MARLAGVPGLVIERAKQILAQLENAQLDPASPTRRARTSGKLKTADLQLSLFAPEEHPVVDEVRQLDLDSTTPLAALAWLQAWQTKLKE